MKQISSTWFKGDIVFKTNNIDGTNPAASATERLRIKSDGNVGINNTLATAKLQIHVQMQEQEQ